MFSHREYYEMVRAYIESGWNLCKAQKLYEEESVPRLRVQGLNPKVPTQSTIFKANQRLLDYGQFTTPTHSHGRGSKSARHEDLEEKVLDFFEKHPTASGRAAARHFSISHSTLMRIINAAGLRPHNERVQEVNNADAIPRRHFCEWLLANRNANILWTDEALFTREGLYNCHNEHWWSFRAHVYKGKLHKVGFSVNVWAGIIGDRLVGPCFIEGHLTGVNYLSMLQGVIAELIDDVPLALLRNFFYQQDDASPHFARDVRQFLTNEYGEQWIGRKGPVPWPPRSPDLNPCNFFLWNELRRRVYENEVQSQDELKANIISAFDDLKSDHAMLKKMQKDIYKRAKLCLKSNGQRFEKLLRFF